MKTILSAAAALAVGGAGVWLAVNLGTATTAAEAVSPAKQDWDVRRGGEIVSDDTAVRESQDKLPFIAVEVPIEGSSQTYELQLVESRDQLLIPVGVRKPEGEGPFPAIIVGSGNGHDSFRKVSAAMYAHEPMFDMMIERGYVVVYSNYRNEVPQAYNKYRACEYMRDDISGGARALLAAPCLDHNDYIEVIQHIKSLPYTDPEAVGTVGSSHNGELQLKSAGVISWGAAVPIEGASYELLAVDVQAAPRQAIGGEDRLLWLPDVETILKYTDVPAARERIARIDDQMPILHIGRDHDHLQGVFRLAYELSEEAGKNVEWRTYDHELHGFGLLSRDDDGSFNPGELRMEVFETWMSFFDRHLKGQTRAGSVGS